MTQADPDVQLGLRANWRQFWILVLVNAFVGAMVGLERTVLPLLAEEEFGLASRSAILTFLVTFGATKAVTNLFAGILADRVGRKPVLVAGWIVAIPVPLLLIWAPSWSWIIAANVLLGVNQGLAWSTTVIMKIDLVGPRRRGFAMGLNEFAGYLAVAFSAFATGYVASRFGLRPEPFYLGIGIVAVGMAISLLFVRDTAAHVRVESAGEENKTRAPDTREIFVRTSFTDPALMSCSQAGLVNNLNDGLAWGLFPLFFAASGFTIQQIGFLAGIYPATWGLFQLWTGALSDRWGRKWFIVGGMILQGMALVGVVATAGFLARAVAMTLLGVGTALVYPTLLAAVSDSAGAAWRGAAVGVYRFWRDSGYAVGAVVAGVLADAFSTGISIGTIGAVTMASGLLVAWRMPGPQDINRAALIVPRRP